MKNDQKSLLCSSLIKEIYDPGMFIVKEGDVANCLYIIKEGEVECRQKGVLIRTLVKGDHFGDKAILSDSKRTLDVISKTVSIIYSISIETLKTILGDNYKDLLFINSIKLSFKSSPVFKKLNRDLIEKCYSLFKTRDINKNEVALKKGDPTNKKLIIIIEGILIDVIINFKFRKILKIK